MGSESRNFLKAERLYETGEWDEAEAFYQKVIDNCDRTLEPSRRQLTERSESLSRRFEIARAMRREDDAERLSGMVAEE